MNKADIKILIVDDDEKNLRILEEVLDGYFLERAHDGDEALTKVKEFMPNLILLDVMMPGMTGLDVCKRVKNNQDTNEIKVILVSGKALHEEQEAGFNAGADAYITKPFFAEDIEKIVHDILSEQGERS